MKQIPSLLCKQNLTPFEKVLEVINRIPNINRGGCGVVAYYLHKYYGADIYFVDKGQFNDIICKMNIQNATPWSPSHAVVKYKGSFYHSEGNADAYVQSEEVQEVYQVAPYLVKKAIQRVDLWNPMFDRRFIKEVIRACYRGVKNDI